MVNHCRVKRMNQGKLKPSNVKSTQNEANMEPFTTICRLVEGPCPKREFTLEKWKIIKIEICREFEEFSQPFLHHCQADSYHQIGSHWGRNLPTTQVAGKSWSNHRGVVDTLLEPRPHDHHHRGQEVKSVLLLCEEWSKQNQLILQQSALRKLLRTQSLCTHPRHRS